MSDVNANDNENNSQSQSFVKGGGGASTSFISKVTASASKVVTLLELKKNFVPIVCTVVLALFIVFLPIFYIYFFYYGIGGYLIPYRMTNAEDSTSDTSYEGLKLKPIGRTKFAARLGNPRAQFVLGELYYWGINVPDNNKKAFNLWLISAKKGNREAQYRVGNCYEYGEDLYKGSGVKKNYAKAIKWYLKAAKKGHAEAQYRLGDIYYNNLGTKDGVKRDDKIGVYWWKQAAKQGNAKAKEKLDFWSKYFPEISNSTNDYDDVAPVATESEEEEPYYSPYSTDY